LRTLGAAFFAGAFAFFAGDLLAGVFLDLVTMRSPEIWPSLAN
jgi:hypothetical protein